MKKLLGGIVATALVVGSVLVPSSAKAAGGEWVNGDGGWWYKNSDGTYAYSEWVDGCWLNSDGYWTYKNTASWKKDSKAWYYQDTSGWYPASTAQWIDGTKYWFNAAGYAECKGWCWTNGGWYYVWDYGKYAQSEWVDGYWISANQYWTYQPQAQWYKDSVGWYYMDSSGYYEKSTTVKIDGVEYTFDDRGYLVEKQDTPVPEEPEKQPEETKKSYNTEFTPNVDASATFTFAPSGKGADLESLLASYTSNGTTKDVTYNGKTYTVKNDNGKIVIVGSDKTIADVVNGTTTEKVTVSFNSKLTDLVKAINTSGKGSYAGSVQCGGVTFSDFSANGTKVTFKANGTSYDATIDGTKIVLDGDLTGQAWVQSLTKSGVATAAKVEK
ncbi:MAG: hypothetical protein K6E27_04260 [Eubacterium sp.]|nr:hypothetical protein [Eubacterium sp.]